MTDGVRIAMWSGPRNISTALMRSWGNRPDTFVTDEPFYAHYLQATGLPHPGAEEVIAQHETDWRKVVGWLGGPVPEGKATWYIKHMAHHMLPGIDMSWTERVTNCFLIREPREVLPSLGKFIPHPTLSDTGLPQQAAIFDRVRQHTGRTPPVVVAADLLRNPRGILTGLCHALGVKFDEAMLCWAPGPRTTDGVWAKHWYANVEPTTGFQPYQPKDQPVPDALLDLLRECQPLYDRLYASRLTASSLPPEA